MRDFYNEDFDLAYEVKKMWFEDGTNKVQSTQTAAVCLSKESAREFRECILKINCDEWNSIIGDNDRVEKYRVCDNAIMRGNDYILMIEISSVALFKGV